MKRPSEMHRKMKITLWLDPAEYWQLMRMSTGLHAGNLSMHKFMKAQLGLVKPKETHAPVQALTAIVRHMQPYLSLEDRREREERERNQRQASVVASPRHRQELAARQAAARKPRRSPRRLAA
jgi:hypothetical protein